MLQLNDTIQKLARDMAGPIWPYIAQRITGVTAMAAIYNTNAGQSIASGAAPAIINFGDVVSDPLGLVTTGASWAFTAPIAGIYLVSAHIIFVSTTGWAPGERGLLQTFRNGVVTNTIARADNYPAVATLMFLGGTAMIPCAAGDTIDVRVAQNSGAALTLDTTATNNVVAIARIA